MTNQGGFERPAPIDPGPGGGGGGFRIVGIVLLVLGVAVFAVCAGGAWWLSQNEAVMDGLESITASISAPGTDELRAAGCSEAMVLDPGVFFRVAGELSQELGELAEGEAEGLLPDALVNCTTSADTDLTCDEVAEVYRAAVPDLAGPFMAQVTSGSADPCQQVYAADGASLGSLEEWTRARQEELEGGSDDAP